MDHLSHFNRLQNDLKEVDAKLSSLRMERERQQNIVNQNQTDHDVLSVKIVSMKSLLLTGISARVEKAVEVCEVLPEFKEVFVSSVTEAMKKEVSSRCLSEGFSLNDHHTKIIFANQTIKDLDAEIKENDGRKSKINKRITKARESMREYLERLEDKCPLS